MRERLRRAHVKLLNGRSRLAWERLRYLHKGQRCVILGNGPSLRGDDLTSLQGEVTFAANKIYLLYKDTPWRPTYYNVEDELVAVQNDRDIVSRVGPVRKAFFRREFRTRFAEMANTLFYDDWHNYRPFPRFSTDPATGMFWGSTVTYINLQLAYWMGFEEIYFIGMDFSFLTPKTFEKDGLLRGGGEINHFSPEYRKVGERWNQPNLDLQLRAFEYGRDWLNSRGVKVFNATRGGKLEVFPRVSFDDVFKR